MGPVGCKDKTKRKRRGGDDDGGEVELEEDDRNGDMESPVKKGRITNSAVHREFEPVELFHKRLGKTVEGRRCLHCEEEFLCKNKSNLQDHIRVFHKDVYKRAEAIDDAAREAKRISLKTLETGSAPIPSYTLVSAEKLSTQNEE